MDAGHIQSIPPAPLVEVVHGCQKTLHWKESLSFSSVAAVLHRCADESVSAPAGGQDDSDAAVNANAGALARDRMAPHSRSKCRVERVAYGNRDAVISREDLPWSPGASDSANRCSRTPWTDTVRRGVQGHTSPSTSHTGRTPFPKSSWSHQDSLRYSQLRVTSLRAPSPLSLSAGGHAHD